MRCPRLVRALALALAIPAAVHADDEVRLAPQELANTGSARIEYRDEEWLKVDLDVNGVRIERLRLRKPRGLVGMGIRHQSANRARIMVANGTDRNVAPSLALAVFDAEGRLLAAGNTGLSGRPVKPGEYREMELHLGGVYRHLDDGKHLYVTLEF